jgi:hypothetical protein
MQVCPQTKSWVSSVNIVMRYGLGCSLISGKGKKFLFDIASRLDLGSTQHLIQLIPEG